MSAGEAVWLVGLFAVVGFIRAFILADQLDALDKRFIALENRNRWDAFLFAEITRRAEGPTITARVPAAVARQMGVEVEPLTSAEEETR